MHERKVVHAPMSSTQSLKLNDDTPSHDAAKYHWVIVKIQYLSFTRPDVSFFVNKLFQFMHAPFKAH